MSELLSEILISIVILSLIALCLPLYHQTIDLMGELAQSSLEEDGNSDYLLMSQPTFACVAALIETYSANADITIYLHSSRGSKAYVTTTLAEDPYPLIIANEQLFLMDVLYMSNEIATIHFTLQEE